MLTSTLVQQYWCVHFHVKKLSIKNSVANENTPLLAPPPRKIYARMANENVWSVNENSGSAFVSRPTDQRMKEENQMQNMQCIKNEVNDFACNLFIILVSKTFYSVQFIFSQVSWKMTHFNWYESDSIREQ